MPDYKEGIDLSGLYLELSPKQLAEAEYNLTRYVDVVRRIYERIHEVERPLEVE
jgi:hypothetical protein